MQNIGGLLEEMQYLVKSVMSACVDAFWAFRINPQFMRHDPLVPFQVRPWRLRETLKFKTIASSRKFSRSLEVRLARSVVIPHLPSEGLMTNVLHVLEVLARARPSVPIKIEWRLKGVEKGFKYGEVGSDVWRDLFLPLEGDIVGESYIADDAIDNAFWGNGKSFLKGRSLYLHRKKYNNLFEKWIVISNDRVNSEVRDIVDHAIGERYCIGVHKRVGNAMVARNQHDGRIPSTQQFIECVHSRIREYSGEKWVVFLSTDDKEAIPAFEQEFRERLIVRRSPSRTTRSEQEVHCREWGHVTTKDAEDVLIDTLLLSKSSELVHVASAISTAASIINPNLLLVHV